MPSSENACFHDAEESYADHQCFREKAKAMGFVKVGCRKVSWLTFFSTTKLVLHSISRTEGLTSVFVMASPSLSCLLVHIGGVGVGVGDGVGQAVNGCSHFSPLTCPGGFRGSWSLSGPSVPRSASQSGEGEIRCAEQASTH